MVDWFSSTMKSGHRAHGQPHRHSILLASSVVYHSYDAKDTIEDALRQENAISAKHHLSQMLVGNVDAQARFLGNTLTARANDKRRRISSRQAELSRQAPMCARALVL